MPFECINDILVHWLQSGGYINLEKYDFLGYPEGVLRLVQQKDGSHL